jgi:hypothetical protein
MQRWHLVVCAFLAALGLVGLADAQQRFGGGFGGGGGRMVDPLQLLNNASVKKELDLTDDEIEKIPEAVRKALAGVLNDKQLKRLDQIVLQQKGTAAFSDATVADKLKLTDEQQGNIKTILADQQKEMREAFKDAGGNKGDFKGRMEKIQAMRKETEDKIQDVLTSDQKRTWKQMLGEPFKLETNFGGFGGGDGTGKKRFQKKTDTE